MKKMAVAGLATLCTLSFNAWTATSKQERTAECNKEAGDRNGGERKEFMKSCLSAKKDAGGTRMSQQDKMRTCNKQAAGKKGDERKQFMSGCLKG